MVQTYSTRLVASSCVISRYALIAARHEFDVGVPNEKMSNGVPLVESSLSSTTSAYCTSFPMSVKGVLSVDAKRHHVEREPTDPVGVSHDSRPRETAGLGVRSVSRHCTEPRNTWRKSERNLVYGKLEVMANICKISR